MKNLLCRFYQWLMKMLSILMPWREPALLEGDGSVLRLPAVLAKDGVGKPLIITGPTLHRLGATDELVRALREAHSAPVVFDRVSNDPTIQNVEDAAACYRQNGCDAIIAFGGGSPMDCAKLCGARIARPDLKIAQMRGMLKIHLAIPPLYAVPTTSGTGSEVTIAAVVTDETHRKYAVGDFTLIPRVAVLDPTLTVGMPPSVTASSGMDALCHAVEAYIGRSNTSATRKNAARAVRLVFENLRRAFENGGDMPARNGMQQAAYLAGLAFTRANVGYAHAIAHAVGGRYGVPHGMACAIALPKVLRAYGKPAQSALAALAQETGIGAAAQTPAEKADAFIDAIEALNSSLCIAPGYIALQAADIPTLATLAAKEGNLFYPAPKILSQPMLADVLQQLVLPAQA